MSGYPFAYLADHEIEKLVPRAKRLFKTDDVQRLVSAVATARALDLE